MDNLTVIDGDFIVQASDILHTSPASEPLLDLQILNANYYAMYKTHLDYLRAGARIIKTNTQRATVEFVMKHLHVCEYKARLVIAIAVKMAKQAVFNYYEETGGNTCNVMEFQKRRALIAGSCGSYGVSRIDEDVPIEYWNFIPRQVISAWHYSQVEALLIAGVDLLAFESIPCLMEAKTILTILTRFPGTRAWITFSCSQEGKLADGNSFAEAAAYCYDFLPQQIIAIGADCHFPQLVKHLMRNINAGRDSKIPFMFHVSKQYISSLENTGECDSTTVKSWNNFVQECVDTGILYIGGSSNTNAIDIKKINEQIESSCFLRQNCHLS